MTLSMVSVIGVAGSGLVRWRVVMLLFWCKTVFVSKPTLLILSKVVCSWVRVVTKWILTLINFFCSFSSSISRTSSKSMSTSMVLSDWNEKIFLTLLHSLTLLDFRWVFNKHQHEHKNQWEYEEYLKMNWMLKPCKGLYADMNRDVDYVIPMGIDYFDRIITGVTYLMNI